MSSLQVDSKYYPITGVQRGLGPHGEVPMRMEIDHWWNSEDRIHQDQVSLFIKALKNFQEMDIKDKLSYFAVAGIHAEPNLPWDEGADSGKRKWDYCHHSRNTFPTWHRTYLLLFEQRVYEIMMDEVIPKFPEHEQIDLIRAAEQWRLPYWDWAMKKPIYDTDPVWYDYDVPQLIRLEAVKIRVPGGFKWVKNPLYAFRMPKNAPMSSGKVSHVEETKDNPEIHFEACKSTSRYPPTNDPTLRQVSHSFLEGYQNNDAVMRALRDYKLGVLRVGPEVSQGSSGIVGGGNLTASLREAFSRVINMPKYEDFSTKARKDMVRLPAWGSLESIHDSLHLWCGGGGDDQPAFGHMYWQNVAAFDPIFWLHHCNVDRGLALWQTLHPREEDPSNWFTDDNTAKSGLKPFRNNKGLYWTSNDVYETATLGYTYTDLPKRRLMQDGVTSVNIDRPLEELKEELNKLYNSTRRAEQKAAMTDIRLEPLNVTEALAVEPTAKVQTQISANSSAKDAPKAEDKLEVFDYIFSAKYERFALKGSPFTVRAFIGKPPANSTPLDAIEYKHEVGQIFNFVSPLKAHNAEGDDGCGNCREQAEAKMESTGQVVLTNALITRYKQQVIHENAEDTEQVLRSMDPTDVIPFLKRHLHWQVSRADGQFVPLDRIPSLKVAVAVGKALHYADLSELSEYHEYKVMYDVTAEREAGARPEDHLFALGTAY